MKYFTFLLFVFTFMSCGNSKDASAMENNNKSMNALSGAYQISTISNQDVSKYNLTIEFNDSTKTVSGFSGCNRFTGTYKISGNNITIGPLASTRMACMESINSIETSMLKALSNINTVSSKDKTIFLLQDDDLLLSASQENSYIIEYTAMSRGFFNKYVFENGKISIQKDRTSTPTVRTCSQEETNTLIEEIKTLDLEQLNSLKAPTEKRFVDAAAIAVLKITYQGTSYQTPEFDHGKPNKYIASLVSAFLELTEKEQ